MTSTGHWIFQLSLVLFRTALDMTEEQPLVLFTDEVGHLKEPDSLLKELMSEADSHDGKLVFVFAHISQQYLNKCATGGGSGGREVIGLPLETLPIDVWKTDSRFEQWKNADEEPSSASVVASMLRPSTVVVRWSRCGTSETKKGCLNLLTNWPLKMLALQ